MSLLILNSSKQILSFLCIRASNIKFYSCEMDKPLDEADIAAMEGQLRDCLAEDRRHVQVNDVKCDAIHTARTYEEFADRVAAAHLRPLEKSDYKNKTVKNWNQYATKD